MTDQKQNEDKSLPKIMRGTDEWERLANILARSSVIIRECRECGGPVIHGYWCTRCGSKTP